VWQPQAKLGDGFSPYTIPKACGFEVATRLLTECFKIFREYGLKQASNFCLDLYLPSGYFYVVIGRCSSMDGKRILRCYQWEKQPSKEQKRDYVIAGTHGLH